MNVSPHEIELNINYYVDHYNIYCACFNSQSRGHTKIVLTRMPTGSIVTPVTLSIIGSMSMLAGCNCRGSISGMDGSEEEDKAKLSRHKKHGIMNARGMLA